MDLKDFIKVYPNVLSRQTCDRLIQEFEKHSSNFTEYETDLYKFTQLYFHGTDLEGLSNAFIGQITPYVHQYFKDVGIQDYVEVKAFEDVRIKRYHKGVDEFRTHIDASTRETSIRYLACLLYLNDSDGSTDFPLLDYSIKPEAGSLLLFPPLWMYPHTGRMPTDCDKYLMMTFLNYP